MGFFDDAVSWVSNPIGNAAGQIFGSGAKKWADPMGYARESGLKGVLGMDQGGGESNPYATAISGDRAADFAAGKKRGDEIFNSQDMLDIQKRKDDLSKGYNGAELGALRAQGKNQIAGQQAAYSSALGSKLARAGVGGARAAAMQGAQNVGFNKNTADFENKLTADNAALIRAGEQDATDFALRRKYGGLSTELGYGQLGVNERAGDKALAANNKKEDKGIIGNLLDGLF